MQKNFKKILKGKFSLTDYAKQLDQISNMGGVQSLLKYLPGMTNIKEKVQESLENNDIFKKAKSNNKFNDSKRKNVSRHC